MLFYKIYFQSVYNTYFDGMCEDEIQSLFDELDDTDQQIILLQLLQNIETSPNYADSIISTYDTTQINDLLLVFYTLERLEDINIKGYEYGASQAMFTSIYNLYEAMYNINSEATLTGVMNYIISNTNDYNKGTYDAESITEHYLQQEEQAPQQIAAPSDPFSFEKPNQQSNLSERELLTLPLIIIVCVL